MLWSPRTGAVVNRQPVPSSCVSLPPSRVFSEKEKSETPSLHSQTQLASPTLGRHQVGPAAYARRPSGKGWLIGLRGVGTEPAAGPPGGGWPRGLLRAKGTFDRASARNERGLNVLGVWVALAVEQPGRRHAQHERTVGTGGRKHRLPPQGPERPRRSSAVRGAARARSKPWRPRRPGQHAAAPLRQRFQQAAQPAHEHHRDDLGTLREGLQGEGDEAQRL